MVVLRRMALENRKPKDNSTQNRNPSVYIASCKRRFKRILGKFNRTALQERTSCASFCVFGEGNPRSLFEEHGKRLFACFVR